MTGRPEDATVAEVSAVAEEAMAAASETARRWTRVGRTAQ